MIRMFIGSSSKGEDADIEMAYEHSLRENCTELVKKALDKGLVINVTKHRTIRLLPPLICKEKDLYKIVDIIEELIIENYE